MKHEVLPLLVGLPGPGLGWSERSVLERVQPAGVILFSRNIESADQVRELIAQLNELEPAPFVCIDLEGGLVNRLTALWGDLPTPRAAAAAGRRAMRALGEAAGAACLNLGIHLDFAPVVDLECEGGFIAHQDRSLSLDPERTVTLARVFNQGLTAWSVSGCAKHFPGLGAVPIDTHDELPKLDLDLDALTPHLGAFEGLAADVPAVMVGHVVVPALGDAKNPASLSSAIVELAAELPGNPVVLSDDLEMGALATHGTLPKLVIRALKARNHGILISKSFDQLETIADELESAIADDSRLRNRFDKANTRLGTLRRDLRHRLASTPAPDETTVSQLWKKAREEAKTTSVDTVEASHH
ncbi:MAG: glycoside hydrolase family 3 protein [bacterium]|nr:glycoside hydrolase family 3 protein [bacterium]